MSEAEPGELDDARSGPAWAGRDPVDDSAARLSCLIYRTRNLGDMIQTLALSRLLSRMTGVYRHALDEAPARRGFVVNGFLEGDAPPREGPVPLFAGVSGPYWRREAYLSWLRRSPWSIGARDPVTWERLGAEGIRSEMIGCATLTLPRYDGPRSGIYSVDCDGPGTRMTHVISRNLSLAGQWAQAREFLEKYRKAEAVHTSRLHVALPCLAFGTPVWVARPHGAAFPERFSLIDALGCSWEKLTVKDVSAVATAYREFLGRHLGLCIRPGEPVCPIPVRTNGLRWTERIRFAVRDKKWEWTARWRGVRPC